MVETAGIALPYFNVTFKTADVTIKNKVIENNPITIKLGHSPADVQIFDISLVEKTAKPDAANQYYVVNFKGFLTDKRFLIERKIECYNGTSLQVLKQLAAEYFDTELSTSITSVSDVAGKWRQCNETAQVFMSEVWLHMNIAPSVPLMAINRDGTVTLKDLDSIKKEVPKWVFTPSDPATNNEVKYYNKFKTKSFKFMSNLYSGYGRVISIPTTETGNYDVIISDNDPELSATQTAEEQMNAGRTIFEGFYNNDNVHDKWHQSYFHNSSKLVKMSSIEGNLSLLGYYKNMKLLDLVNITTLDNTDASIAGKYIIDTMVVSFGHNKHVQTEVFVTRDNANNIENNTVNKAPTLPIKNSQQAELLTSVRNLRRLVSLGRQKVDGTLLQNITGYATSLKYGIFSSFSIAGATLNLNSQVDAVNSLKYIGNSIVNRIIDLYIPAPYNYVLQNFAINNYSLLSYFTTLINQFVLVTELAALITDITSLVAKSTNTLAGMASYSTATGYAYEQEPVTTFSARAVYFEDTPSGVVSVNIGEEMTNSTDQIRVTNILNTFEDNTAGVDIPLIVPTLTDSELLQTTTDLTDSLADKIVLDLTNRGYLDGVTNFKNILLGIDPMDFNTIDTINTNTGNIMSIRHWGTFDSLIELTDFYIRKSFKDKYKTVPVTKIINARGGKKIFFALPSSEQNLKFYINSTLITLDKMEMSLRYFDMYGKDIPYSVYYTSDIFNSNSVLMELRESVV